VPPTGFLKKEPKLYCGMVGSAGGRRPFENLIAGHLLKLAHYFHDRDGYQAEVHFLRDTVGREVDFLVAVDGKPWFAVESSWGRRRESGVALLP